MRGAVVSAKIGEDRRGSLPICTPVAKRAGVAIWAFAVNFVTWRDFRAAHRSDFGLSSVRCGKHMEIQ